MCGLAGFFALEARHVDRAKGRLWAMSRLITHRGPDGMGHYISPNEAVGLAHRRLAIIDLSPQGAQPMFAPDGKVMVFNGEIYNYPELRAELSGVHSFKTQSDSEVLLAAYSQWGEACLTRLRGMFSVAIFDPTDNSLFLARDPFGIKPLYYAIVDGVIYFASEMKAILPNLKAIETDTVGFSEYLTFQYPISDQTLFSGIKTLLPGHFIRIKNGQLSVSCYWDIRYSEDESLNVEQWADKLRFLLEDSIDKHLRADVPVGSYLSGGVDSGLTTLLSARHEGGARKGFHGKFTQYKGYDESHYAAIIAQKAETELFQVDITADDFARDISDVIYHLDQPVAGPGSFPQYEVSRLAASELKVVLGGQGGDEIFGGYARYFIGYFEALMKASIEGEDAQMSPNWPDIGAQMGVLREYKPLIKQTFSSGLFDPLSSRYFALIDRSHDLKGEVIDGAINHKAVRQQFEAVFCNPAVMERERPFERMLHFDFKCLLPALLQVEDRMSMAHGLESRVPFLDLPLVEAIASCPTAIKFEGGRMKHMLRRAFEDVLPQAIFDRRDKMGFPVPLKEWWANDLNGFVHDLFGAQKARERPYLEAKKVLDGFTEAGQFSRKTWGLLSLELWQQRFHDRADTYRAMINDPAPF